MPEDSIDPAGNAQSPAPAVPGMIPSAPPPVDNWQARFTGLQQSLQSLLQTTGWGKLDAIPKKIEVEAWQTAATQLTDLRTQFEAKNQEAVALATEKAALSARATQAERQVRKASLVAEKAPQVINMLDYIPVADDDAAQTAAIEAFVARLTVIAAPRGAGPLPPISQPGAQQPQVAPPDLMVQLSAAYARGDTPEIQRLEGLWKTKELKT